MKARVVKSPVMFRDLPYGLCLGKVDAVGKGGGTKEIKPQLRLILETIDTLSSISYNPHFHKNNHK